MKTEIELDAGKELEKILDPSLKTDSRVHYQLKGGETLNIKIETDSIGPLRGSTDTAFRLAMLADKIISR